MRTIVVALILLGALPGTALSQRAIGSVVDESSGALIVGAVITARNAHGDVVGLTTTDARGEYSLRLPQEGPYAFRVQAFGYVEIAASDLDLEPGLPTILRFEVEPEPVQLEGVEVDVAVERRLPAHIEALGLRAADLDERLVTREEIAARQSARDYGSVLEWQRIPGVNVARPQNATHGSFRFMCLYQMRGRLANGKDRCSLVVLNGTIIGLDAAAMIDPRDLENIVVLTPVEATRLYGTIAGGGAVLLFTRYR